MPLLNYTTQITAEKTVGEIQAMLAKAGALAIMLEYNDGVISGVSFKIKTVFGPTGYTLPCDTGAVLRILGNEMRAGKVPPRLVNQEQAARVGWRIIKDWIEAQLALVETEMVNLDQVFLPYARTSNGTTVYQRYLKHGMGMLALEGPQS